ncbi:hypothetical protein P43SY_009151 [Pythium insidiosum]|uniref:EGF-like domain-containing protein n=1 Tax=Pythium insidiosum TaxID=114742 RepID=A0AAD5MCU3_PYTIN|nr:hypothetical protein P43SY_009151 [Pythium insidiosum]
MRPTAKCPVGPAWVAPARATDVAHYDVECSNMGTCDRGTGKCLCVEGFTGTACQRLACPNACNEAGECLSLRQLSRKFAVATEPLYELPWDADMIHGCFCRRGYHGYDCSKLVALYSEAVFPFAEQKNGMCAAIVATVMKGLSWFSVPDSQNRVHSQLAVCSNAGICDRSNGECMCYSPFTGDACDLMKCPGEPSCSGHGQCLSIQMLSREADVDDPQLRFDYGTDPNNPLTFDRDMIQGCKCDPGYEGFDCSQRSCPRGDDPTTTGQVDEVKVIQCIAISGSFQLEYRVSRTFSVRFRDPDTSSDSLAQALSRHMFSKSEKNLHTANRAAEAAAAADHQLLASQRKAAPTPPKSTSAKLERALQFRDQCDREVERYFESKRSHVSSATSHGSPSALTRPDLLDKTYWRDPEHKTAFERLMRKISPGMNNALTTHGDLVHVLHNCQECATRITFCVRCAAKASEYFENYSISELQTLYGRDLPPPDAKALDAFTAAMAEREYRATH